MLSKKDTQILRELDKNSRLSNTQISKKVGLKKETVNYIIKKLEKEKIIGGYFSLINYFKLGSNLCKLLIRYENIGEKGETKIINWLSKKSEIIWIGKTEGKWDLIITIRDNDIEKVYSLLEKFNRSFSKNIKEKQLLIPYELIWMNEKYFSEDKKDNYIIRMKKTDQKEIIDKIDKKIINIIETNSRTSLIELSSKIKLTAQAISKRIKNLTRKKIISGFKLRTNHEKLEKGYHHIFISLKDFSKIDEIISYYEESKHCVFIMKYHGNYDFHMELISESQNDFRETIKDFREKFGDIISDYQHLTILEELKLTTI